MNIISKIKNFLNNLFIKEKKLSLNSILSKKQNQFTSGNAKTIRVFKKKGCDCVSCDREGSYFKKNGKVYNLYTKDNILMTKDHIKPKAKGGSNNLFNLQPMCYECNQKKADVMPDKLIKISSNKDLINLKMRFNKINKTLNKKELSEFEKNKVKNFIEYILTKNLQLLLFEKELEFMKNIKMDSLSELKKINDLMLNRL